MAHTPHIDDPIPSVFALMRHMMDIHPARSAGTQGCRAAAQTLADSFPCGQAVLEQFAMHPDALWQMGKIAAISYCLCALFLNFGGLWGILSFCIGCAAMLYAAVSYFADGTLFDRFFKKAEGVNVIATLDPERDIKRQILIASHHDSPYVFPFLVNHQKLAALRLFFALLSFVLVTGLSAAAAISSLFTLAWRLQAISLVVALAGALFVLPLYRFISKEPSPGAGDNLVSCALCVNMFARFCARAKDGHPLQHTKLACLSTDGEECGQRGSAFYAMAHAEELHAVETAVINLDSLFNLCDLAILNRDRQRMP